MNTTTPSFTYQQIIDTLAALPSYVPSLKIYYTSFATKEKTVTRTWKERLFTLPWRPCQRDKVQSRPAIYAATIPIPSIRPGLPTLLQAGLSASPRHRTILIAHPSFKDTIEKAMSADRQALSADRPACCCARLRAYSCLPAGTALRQAGRQAGLKDQPQ